MKIITTTVLLFGSIISSDSHDNFEIKYDQANQFCLSIIPEVETISKTYFLNSKELIPIVFPECTRFNIYSDKIETAALRYLYVEHGSESANFSIGAFQMKPAFIESLDLAIQSSSKFNDIQKKHFNYLSIDTKSKRSERFLRLNELEWQIHYLCAFNKILDERYELKKWESKAEKIAFYASAYNYNFNASETEILNYQFKKAFPFGDGNLKESYGNIAKNYFLKLNHYAK